MENFDTVDIVTTIICLIGAIAYFSKGKYWAVQDDTSGGTPFQNGLSSAESRNIIEKMSESGKKCVVFYGSQTGTAEDYASRLAKEGLRRFGLKTMVANLEDYDYDNLDTFPEDSVAVFVLATYGEGEPTDNAIDFYHFITGEDISFSEGVDENPLVNMKYVAFGLGNNTYEYYNAMVRNVDRALSKHGAQRIGKVGEGDDGKGTMEEDFLDWKDDMWKALADSLNLEEREGEVELAFIVTEEPHIDHTHHCVFLGEPNENHRDGTPKGPYNHQNPFIAPISESKELFTSKDRNCLHLEINIKGSGLSYVTGDHVAVWPTNSGKEVDRFLKVFGLDSKRNMVINVKASDPTTKVPFPSPTTYDAAVRYQMEICAPVSRQFVSMLAPYSPNEDIKSVMTKIGEDKDYFHSNVAKKNLNIAQLLQMNSDGEPWDKVPFSLLIEGIHQLQPRYYSISSSSKMQKEMISITAVVESNAKQDAPHVVKGVTTNYLLALKLKQNEDPDLDPFGLNYSLERHRGNYNDTSVPIHIRNSNFKLPPESSTPIIMVGPGTGVAPFRGFVQERVARAELGEKIGKTVLFYGCRNESEDFLYRKEWMMHKNVLGHLFEYHVAFSRTGAKEHVQHKMKAVAKQINELLEQGACFYVCGDAANMAGEVKNLLINIILDQRSLTLSEAEGVINTMRTSNRYQEDVWS